MADWKKLLTSAADQVGEAAKAAGGTVREAAEGARKVAGIGVGTVKISHNPVCWGECLRGTLTLELPEPIEAESLTVMVKGSVTRIPVENLASKRADPLATQVIYQSGVIVAERQTFTSGKFAFAVELPDRPPEPDIGGLIGDVVRAAQAFKSMTETPVRWRVEATLAIPWRRNIRASVDIAVHEPKADAGLSARRPEESSPLASRPEPVAPTPEPVAPTPEPVAPTPVAMTLPHGWNEALAAALAAIERRGEVVIRTYSGPPVDPQAVMAVLQRHPDLDAEILKFYAMMDGFQVIVGQPKVQRPRYEAARLLAAEAEGRGGRIYCLHETCGAGDAIDAEFHDVRSLEIPPLSELLGNRDAFGDRDDGSGICGAVILSASSYYGVTQAAEIRSWGTPAPGEAGRTGYYDSEAADYQAALARREAACSNRWWAVLGEDHGAALVRPARVLRWTEMLTECLEHLRGD